MELSDKLLHIPVQLNFQIYPYAKYSGLVNMAIDDYFASVFTSNREPIIRFYGWDPYCISIGYHQSLNVFDKIELIKDNIDLIGRPTGGRAILHADELTYSIIFPKGIWSQHELYQYIHQLFTMTLNDLDYKVVLATGKKSLPNIKKSVTDYPCFIRSAETEVEYNGKKIIGSAQKVYKNSILQHGSILIGNYHENISKYFISDESQKKTIDEELASRTICLNAINQRNIKIQQIVSIFYDKFKTDENVNLNFLKLDNELIQKAKTHYLNKYKYENY